MAHVGEELGLVLIRALELLRAQRERNLDALQLIPLILQNARLLLQLGVGLLELGLLRLQPGL